MRRPFLLIACAAILLASAGLAYAQENAPNEGEAVAGDPAAGRAVAESACANCHGLDGLGSEAGVPYLAGQHESYIRAGLAAYKKGERKGEDMAKVAAGLDDKAMADVAAYYAGLKGFNERPAAPGGAKTAKEADPFAAMKEATAVCAGCHGEDGNSLVPGMPSLAGQQVAYLISAMKAYQEEPTRADATMQGLVAGLTRSEIEDMAYFYAAMEPQQTTNPGEGDRFAGQAIAEPCASCHGEDGNSHDPKVPRLAGLDADYLILATTAYKDGSRQNDVMADAVETLRDEDIKNLAAFYASQAPKAPPIRKPLSVAEWTDRCNRCHGPSGNSTDERFPIIAGQKKDYLTEALELYHGGERQNPMMFAMSFLMAESDIEKLAAYYASQRK